MDGVLYRGKKVLPGACETLRELRRRGEKIFFLTNNSAKTRRQYQRRLKEIGIPCSIREIMTSGLATALYLKEKKFKGRKALVVGGYGILKELRMAGFMAEKAGSNGIVPENFDFVVAGLNTDFYYKQLADAQSAVLSGARLIATNRDATYPVENGVRPGGGCLVSALETATSQKALCVGKPNTYSLKKILQLSGVCPRETALVGDRLETDILMGKRAGVFSVLVLTGISTREEARVCPKRLRPDRIINTLKELV